jgi:hypothetical protein
LEKGGIVFMEKAGMAYMKKNILFFIQAFFEFVRKIVNKLYEYFIAAIFAIVLTGCCSAKGQSSYYEDGEPGAYIYKTHHYDTYSNRELHATEFDASDEDGWCRGSYFWKKY